MQIKGLTAGQQPQRGGKLLARIYPPLLGTVEPILVPTGCVHGGKSEDRSEAVCLG